MKPEEISSYVDDLFNPKYQCQHCEHCVYRDREVQAIVSSATSYINAVSVSYSVCDITEEEIENTNPVCCNSKIKLPKKQFSFMTLKEGTKLNMYFSYKDTPAIKYMKWK